VSRLHSVGVELEVPLHDVDLLGIVWHGHYYKYFEIARTALLRSRELDEPTLRELGVAFVIVETRCRHTAPLRYADRFRVEAGLHAEHSPGRLQVGYRIRRLTPSASAGPHAPAGVARGRTTLVTIDAQGNMLPEIPDAILRRFRG
jgi:acyl-CoA thioester hydrolase